MIQKNWDCALENQLKHLLVGSFTVQNHLHPLICKIFTQRELVRLLCLLDPYVGKKAADEDDNTTHLKLSALSLGVLHEPVDDNVNVGWVLAWDSVACHLPVSKPSEAPVVRNETIVVKQQIHNHVQRKPKDGLAQLILCNFPKEDRQISELKATVRKYSITEGSSGR